MAQDRPPSSPKASAAEALELAEAINKLEKAFAGIQAFDCWTCIINVTGFLDGGFKDWPANIQDGLSKAVATQCLPRPGERVEIVAAKCYQDTPDEPPYLRVVVQAFPILVH